MAVPGSEFLSVIYGLASAASWGAGDFSGGLATRRTTVYRVIVVSQIAGGLLLLAAALLLTQAVPSPGNLLLGALAGACGTVGLIALYSGLAQGRMGVVAPTAAVVTAVLPVVVGIFGDGLPSLRQLAGFGVALVAVWFLARGDSREPIRLGDFKLPLIAGIGFGLFVTLIGRVSSESVLWPLIAARCASVALITLYATYRRQGIAPQWNHLPLIALAGILDSGGNALFALAARAGRLDISAVLSSLYPAATVLLAWLVLHERLTRPQWLGVIAALVALVLIAL
ncbi:MAG: DMT family transporter [Anaerolineae bacterium]